MKFLCNIAYSINMRLNYCIASLILAVVALFNYKFVKDIFDLYSKKIDGEDK